MKQIIAKIQAEFVKEALYEGEDIECFLSHLKEFVDRESKGYVYTHFSLKGEDK